MVFWDFSLWRLYLSNSHVQTFEMNDAKFLLSQHIDRDLKPYICLSEECLDSHSAYPTFSEWHRHMKLHDWRWYQKTYLTPSWVCPLCGPSNNAYNNSNALYSHLAESHSDKFPSTELEAISRQSKIEQRRAWNDCLLCCFIINERKSEDKSAVSKRENGQQEQVIVKSFRSHFEMPSPDDAGLDLDLSDTSSDSDSAETPQQKMQRRERSNVIARHIASHLQVLMLLTLRFVALKSDDDDLNEDFKSNSADFDEGTNATTEDTDLGHLSHTHSSDDISMKSVSSEANRETVASANVDAAKNDISVSVSNLDFGLALRQYEDLGAHNGLGSIHVTQWLDQLEHEKLEEEMVKKGGGCVWIIRQHYTYCGCVVTESERKPTCKGSKSEDHICGVIDQGTQTWEGYCRRPVCPNPVHLLSEQVEDEAASSDAMRWSPNPLRTSKAQVDHPNTLAD